MGGFGLNRERIAKAVLRASNLPAAIALAVVVATGIVADNLNRELYDQQQRAFVTEQLNLVRARLSARVNGNIQLVRGLVSAIEAEPHISPERFAAISASLTASSPELLELAAAPDLVVSMVYPYEENRAVIGLDYRSNADQRAAALRARDSGTVVLAGPLDLVQGGVALVARFPVFLPPGAGTSRFWGLLSAVIDVQQLYAESGLTADDLPIEISITGTDGLGDGGDQFYGPRGLAGRNPVTAAIALPNGHWQLSAIPKGGWAGEPSNTWLLRLGLVLGGLLVVVPILVNGRLLEERQTHIRELRTREEDLERLSRRLELALDASHVGVWEMDVDTGRLVWDARMNELYGLPSVERERTYSDWRGALHPEDRNRAEKEFYHALETRGSYRSEFRVVLADGEVRTVRANGSVFEVGPGHHKMIGVNWDVSSDVALNDDLRRAKYIAEARNAELEAAKERIEFASLHDALTGLPNRRFLDEVLDHGTNGDPDRMPTALLHIDLDRFKQINDTLGHVAGDAMLVHAADVLKSTTRAGDFVARIGGDEFVVVCTGPGSNEDLAALANRIIARMRQPVAYEGHECRFGVSVGIARNEGELTDARRLLVNADIALYRAKSRGRNRHEFFTETLQAEIIRTKRTADDILSGIEKDEFEAHFQPQFDARTWEIVGVEALARWRHPTEGLIKPDRFLAIAEDLNVVATIDRLILEKTLVQLREWEAAGLIIPKASVNVSSRRLHDDDLIRSLSNLDIAPGRIAFELVESIFLDESADIVSFNIDRISDLGIAIEIDDFGTGYASILSLLRLKPQRLKIDRQLVAPIVASVAQRRLVESIVEIGRSLGISAVAEGVETFEHAHILKDLGCSALQGFAFAPPMTGSDLVEFARNASWKVGT